jgi:long-chain acyl-CoA synthetase
LRIDDLLLSFEGCRERECLIAGGAVERYSDLENRRHEWLQVLDQEGVEPGAVVGLKADYSPAAVSLLLALLSHRCIASLLPMTAIGDEAYLEDGQIEGLFHLNSSGSWSWDAFDTTVDHPLLRQLRDLGEAGLTIFSSGSTGRPKAVLHSAERLLAKFDRQGKPFRTLAFMLFDHIAGIDTLFYTLGAHGSLVLTERRDPLSVCRLIEDHRVEVLPVSPAFLNLFCLSGDYQGCDLSSLKIITYGSEPMSQGTLDALCEIFPEAKIVQKYGTSEFGSPRALSRANDSLWLKLKGDEIDARVVDGILWVRTETAMLGYLNAASPFDEEGWYCTGDLVETDGDWVRILGRESDIIIVGGEKVYPREVEDAILGLAIIEDVVVKGEPHPMLGQIVTAKVALRESLAENEVRKQVRMHCRGRLAPYKIPAKVEVASSPLTTGRQKKVRQ